MDTDGGTDVIELPARYRAAIWMVGVLTFTGTGAWLVAVVSGLVLTGAGLALGAAAGAGIGVVAVHAFLTLLCALPAHEAGRVVEGSR